jgi:hypothetical protein
MVIFAHTASVAEKFSLQETIAQNIQAGKYQLGLCIVLT